MLERRRGEFAVKRAGVSRSIIYKVVTEVAAPLDFAAVLVLRCCASLVFPAELLRCHDHCCLAQDTRSAQLCM